MVMAMMILHLQQLLPPSLLQEGQPRLLPLLHLLQEALLLHLRLPLLPTPLLLQHLVRQSNNS